MSHSPSRSIVVGGSGFLGSLIADCMAARGDNVVVLDREGADKKECKFFPVDVTDAASTAAAMSRAVDHLGGLDALVYSVGILRPSSFVNTTEQDVRDHIETNYIGAFRIAQQAAKYMRDTDGGSIVFVTSIHGQIGVPNRMAYAASKGAVASMARVMAAELAANRIRVNVLAPGAIDGGVTPDPTTRQGWEASSPIKRVAKGSEVARAAAMLTSEDASFINGQIIGIDGGASTLRMVPAL